MANVGDALARELRELKREVESLADKSAGITEKLDALDVKLAAARKENDGEKGKAKEGVSDF